MIVHLNEAVVEIEGQLEVKQRLVSIALLFSVVSYYPHILAMVSLLGPYIRITEFCLATFDLRLRYFNEWYEDKQTFSNETLDGKQVKTKCAI